MKDFYVQIVVSENNRSLAVVAMDKGIAERWEEPNDLLKKHAIVRANSRDEAESMAMDSIKKILLDVLS